jgi:hypothetical protein
MLIIESGIPIPSTPPRTTPERAAINQLEPGQSFSVKLRPRIAVILRDMASMESRRTGKKFSVRTLGDDVRVWRIS